MSPQVWAGVECTVNRVGDTFFDQIERTGHHTREDDIDRIADLGVRAVRYPVLWERTASHDLTRVSFAWADGRLRRIRERGLDAVVGLVHHGSGPVGTHLCDPAFPELLGAYAGAVAQRYPWVSRYTPINEPLTTARFAGLYGHWYPHGRDTRAFVRALLNQVHGVAAAMRAIREVRSDAELVQTEDIGCVSSTPLLAYQAAYENERRFLSLDLLFGHVTPQHPLHRHLVLHGATERELGRLVDAPTIPAIVGVNYYVTSDRFLDERTHLYPGVHPGGNGRHAYVDVEAVRATARGFTGHASVLRAVHDRYRAPVALTEAHLGCTPDEQLRWLWEAWRGVAAARAEGVDVRAFTAWSAFGAYDWDSLVTLRRDRYEPGLFDVSGGEPQPTPLAELVRDLSRHGRSDHPALSTAGWWRREGRLVVPPCGAKRRPSAPAQPPGVSVSSPEHGGAS